MRAVRIGLALGALLLAGAAPVLAQTVSGTLVDETTGRPVAGAYVLLLGTDSVTRGGGRTDETGAWSVRPPRLPGTYSIRAQKAGFRTVETDFFAVAEQPVVLRLATRPEVVMLEEVTAQRANYEAFMSRRDRRMGFGIGPDEVAARIARYTPASTEHLVERLLPGAEVERRSGGFRIPMRAGSPFTCNATIVVDGERFDPPYDFGEGGMNPPWDINTLVPLWEIRAIEIYNNPLFIPTELKLTFLATDGRPPCGVMLIWTYRGIGEQ